MKFGVGVLGATGYIGTPYRAEIRACPDEATLVALCARRRDLLEAAAREDGALFASSDWRSVVEHPRVTLVVVATPDALHHEAVLACAAAGKHVVCEKPLGMNAAQAREMWLACRDRRLGTFVPFWTRYLPIFARAKAVVEQGTLGEIRAAVYRWHNPRPAAMPFTWRDDARWSAAGSLADVGSHAYDTLRWLTGLEARRVLAHADVLTPPKPDLGSINLDEALRWCGAPPPTQPAARRRASVYDFASVAAVFENGAVGTLLLSHVSFLRKGLAPEVELHGSQASLALDRLSGRLLLARQGEPPSLLETVADGGLGNRFRRHVFPSLRAQLDGQPAPHPTLEDGWRAARFTDAAARSALEGRWVHLSEIDAGESG